MEATAQAADWTGRTAPDLAAIRALAEAAMSALPVPFDAAARGVRLHVAEVADDAMLAALGIENAYELTGLYEGVGIAERSQATSGTLPDTVWLYRRAILDEWADRGDVTLGALVAHIVVHELAHHLGWSDEDIAAIDPWWER
ncbi:MAG: metallopeptidase family protein [Pseudomonadota bacterium]